MEDLSVKVLLCAKHQSHTDACMSLMILSNLNTWEFEHLNYLQSFNAVVYVIANIITQNSIKYNKRIHNFPYFGLEYYC